MIGEVERVSFLQAKLNKQPSKLMTGDKCSEDEALAVVSAAASAFVVFSNNMLENTSTRFSERTYTFPDGLKARTGFFGISSGVVVVHYCSHPFKVGTKNQRKSYSAAAEWYIALDLKIEKITTVRKSSKLDDLDEALEG
jgi:hypothetical protein